MKIKKQTVKIFFTIFLMGFFFSIQKEIAIAENIKVISCSCADASVIHKSIGTSAYVDTDTSCNAYCENQGAPFYFTNDSFKAVIKNGQSTSVYTAQHTCSCSNSGIYSNAITGTFSVIDKDGCISQCQSSKSGVYQYDTNGWLNVPDTVPTIKSGSDKFTYKLLESFPGFFTQGQDAPDFPTLILAIYKFGIWTIGIASLFMITIGGAMYMMSAGNSSKASSAKDIIYDSLIGIVAAMGAYLFLYVINPDLTNIDIAFTKVTVGGVDTITGSALSMNQLSDSAARQRLTAAGIEVSSSGNCTDINNSKCTSLEGIPERVINQITTLKGNCKQFRANCSMVVTGGTETGHKSHGKGSPMIDIRYDAVLRDFLVATKNSSSGYASYGIGQVCTLQQDLDVSYNHSNGSPCEDPSSQRHFHFSFNG